MTASNPRDSVETVFDRRAATYSNHTWHVRYAERLVALADPTAGLRILDAATGTGLAAIAAARAMGPTGQVVGVDVSAGMLARARQAIDEAGLLTIELVRADATTLPQFGDGSFDLVLCSAGLLYLPVQAALREWRRLLRPGGQIGFSTMAAGFPVAARLFRDHARRHGLTLTDPASALGTQERCRRALRDAGFTSARQVGETMRFSSRDLEHAWEAHTRGPHHDAIATLTAEQAETFQRDYTDALADQLRTDADHLLTAEVIYAFGER